MRKRILSVICILAILAGILLAGCSARDHGAAKEIIGIIGAMDVEISTLKEAAKISRTTVIADMEFCTGTLQNKNVVIVKCGMGKVNAGICAQTLIHEFGCTKIINTGVAGSLDNQIDIGDIVVSVTRYSTISTWRPSALPGARSPTRVCMRFLRIPPCGRRR